MERLARVRPYSMIMCIITVYHSFQDYLKQYKPLRSCCLKIGRIYIALTYFLNSIVSALVFKAQHPECLHTVNFVYLIQKSNVYEQH